MRAFIPVLLSLVAASCSTPLTQLAQSIRATTEDVGRYVPTQRDDCRLAVAFLHERARALKITVEYVDLTEDAFGMYYREERKITLQNGMTSCTTLETLAHELGHALQPRTLWITGPGTQVFADAVSYVVVRKIGGYDPRARYATYLAGLKMNVGLLHDYQVDIDQAAQTLTQGWR
jgi:hypothetical protein